MLPKYSLLLSAVLFSCVGVLSDSVETGWWKHAVFYQIYPRSFKDNDNDGIGDLQGIISKLDHLKDIGVTAAWLSPIYTSPQVDQGYDISDFEGIDKDYGTMADFDELLVKAKKLGIKIIMDFVPNHSSNEHEWFVKSEKREAGFKDFYVWMDGKDDGSVPNNWLSHFKYSAWEYSEIRKQYYLHQFAPEQPDLNYNNKGVVDRMNGVLKFWLDKGVDGFRMDAVPYLLEDAGFQDEPPSNKPNVNKDEYASLNHIYTSDLNNTYAMIYQWRELLDSYTLEHGGDERIMMTEANTDIEHTMLYYGDAERNGAHFTFNFLFIENLPKTPSARDVLEQINKWLKHMPHSHVPNWVLGNHDVPRVASRFGPENIDGFNMLATLLPGVAVTYMGEEIGQENGEVTWDEGLDPSACNGNPDDFNSTSRDFERTPFQWDSTTNAGFNQGAKPWLPVSQKYKTNNLALQKRAGNKSNYFVYKELLKLRQDPAFTNGDFSIVTVSDNVLAFRRSVARGQAYVVAFNIGNKPEEVDLTNVLTAKNLKIVIAGENSAKKNGSILSAKFLLLDAHESIVARETDDVVPGDPNWWKHAVFYQIYPRSFKDNNNDGIGDLQGVISKLDHIKDAGIDSVWLSPIYASPQVDNGYDITNYTDIHDEYGTLEDFHEFIAKAHSLGIKVVMDFVPNHSSDQHNWFKWSENNEAGFEDFYIWADANKTTEKEPNNWRSVFKFSAWDWSEKRKKYYLHQFAYQQPDLNFRSEKLLAEMESVLKFWLDRGVNGFRMDAVPYLYEDEQYLDEPLSQNPNANEHDHAYLNHIYTFDQPQNFELVHRWRQYLDEYTNKYGGDPRIMMTEAYTDLDHIKMYYGNETYPNAHFSFNFLFIANFKTATEIVESVNNWFHHVPEDKYVANWVLGNHDNHRVATRFSPETVDGFNMLAMLLPGIGVTYNGEEIGQEDGEVTWEEGQDPGACNGNASDFPTRSRDFERTPFHWDTTINAGFNEGFKTWLPVSQKYLQTNLAAQKVAGIRSHYQVYQELVQLRKASAFANGNVNIRALSETVLAFTRELKNAESYVVVFNFGNKKEVVSLEELGLNQEIVTIVLTDMKSTKPKGQTIDGDDIPLDPHESFVAAYTAKVTTVTTTIQTASTTAPTTVSTTTQGTGAATSITLSLRTLIMVLLCLLLK